MDRPLTRPSLVGFSSEESTFLSNEVTTSSDDNTATAQPPGYIASKVTMRDPAHPKDISQDQDDDSTEPPPPYQSPTAPFTPVLAEKGLTKVSMLPRAAPSAGSEYLHDIMWGTGHYHFQLRGSDNLRAPAVRIYRALKCEIDMIWATRCPKPDINPFHDLGPYEQERISGWPYEWTKDWDFQFLVRNRGFQAEKQWVVHGCLYFKGMSPADRNGIPWNDPDKTTRVHKFVGPYFPEMRRRQRNCHRFTWKFCERSDNPRWGASFTIYSKAGITLPTYQNPWFFLNSTFTEM